MFNTANVLIPMVMINDNIINYKNITLIYYINKIND